MRTQRPRNVTCVPPSAPARERNHQLARLALGGDGRAWDLLYEKAIRSVPAAVRRADFQHLFGDWDYRDITDEALTRCYDHLERYRGLSQFQWWVLGYAKNILRNRIQRQLTRRRNQSLLERAAERHALCQDPLRLLITLERDQFLWEAFYQLTPLDQVIVYQRVFFQTRLRHPGKIRTADQRSGPPPLSGHPQRHPLEFSPPLPDQPRSARVFLFRPRASPVRNSSRSSDSMWLRICALCSRTCMG